MRAYGAIIPCDDFFQRIKAIDSTITIVDNRCLAVPEFTAEAGAADVLLYSTGLRKYVSLGYGGYGYINDEMPWSIAPTAFVAEDMTQLERSYKSAIEDRHHFAYLDSDWLDNRDLPICPAEYRRHVLQEKGSVGEWKDRINEIYASHLPAEIQLDSHFQNWRFNVLVPERDRLLRSLFDAGLFASSHYASLAGVFSAGRAPVADHYHSRILNLFNDQHFSVQMARGAVDLINKHLDDAGSHPRP